MRDDGEDARINGNSLAEVRELVDHLKKVIVDRRTKIRVDLVGQPYVDDPEYWPRIFLDGRGLLRVGARTTAEATRFLSDVLTAVRAGAFDRIGETWRTVIVPPGTLHEIRVTSRAEPIRRLVAKVAYGLAVLAVGDPISIGGDPWGELRRYVLDGSVSDPHPVRYYAPVRAVDLVPGCHVAVVRITNGLVQVVVSLHGSCYIVRVGSALVFSPKVAIAVSRFDGSFTGFEQDSRRLSVILSALDAFFAKVQSMGNSGSENSGTPHPG